MTQQHGTSAALAEGVARPADRGRVSAAKLRRIEAVLRSGNPKRIVARIEDLLTDTPGNRRLFKRVEDLLESNGLGVLLLQYFWKNRATALAELFMLGRFMRLSERSGSYDKWRPRLQRWLHSGKAPPPRFSNADTLRTFAGLGPQPILDIFEAKYRGIDCLEGATLADAAEKLAAGADIEFAYGGILFPRRANRETTRDEWDARVRCAVAADHLVTDWDYIRFHKKPELLPEHPTARMFEASAIDRECEAPGVEAFFRGLDTSGGLVLCTFHGAHFGLLKMMYDRWMADHFVIKQSNTDGRPNVIVTGKSKDTAGFAAIKALMKNKALLVAADGPPGKQSSQVQVFDAIAQFADGTPRIAYEASARTGWYTVLREGERFKPVFVAGPKREPGESFEGFRSRWLTFYAARIESVLSADPANLALRHQWQNYVRKDGSAGTRPEMRREQER